MITPAEITSGLVLHLDPDVLEQRGGTYECPPSFRVQNGHFFLCLDATKTEGRWLPLYTKDGKGRVEISRIGRTGHEKWTGGTFFYHEDQVWTAPHGAVVASADAGTDLSRKGQRNLLTKTRIPAIQLRKPAK